MTNERYLIYSDEALRMMKDSKTDNPYLGTLAESVWKIAHDCAASCVEACSSVEAVEVKHGKWLPGYPVSCSVCGGGAATDYEDANRYEAWLTPYCPHCGARMDGDKND